MRLEGVGLESVTKNARAATSYGAGEAERRPADVDKTGLWSHLAYGGR